MPRDGLERLRNDLLQCGYRSGLSRAQVVLDFGPGLFDRIEVGRVGWADGAVARSYVVIPSRRQPLQRCWRGYPDRPSTALSRLWDYDVLTHRIKDDLGRVVEIELLHEICAVRLDSVRAQVQ